MKVAEVSLFFTKLPKVALVVNVVPAPLSEAVLARLIVKVLPSLIDCAGIALKAGSVLDGLAVSRTVTVNVFPSDEVASAAVNVIEYIPDCVKLGVHEKVAFWSFSLVKVAPEGPLVIVNELPPRVSLPEELKVTLNAEPSLTVFAVTKEASHTGATALTAAASITKTIVNNPNKANFFIFKPPLL